jgi:hypothetical protein
LCGGRDGNGKHQCAEQETGADETPNIASE